MEDPEKYQPKYKNYGVCAFWCLMMLLIAIAGLIFAIVYMTSIGKNLDSDKLATTVAPPVMTGKCMETGCVSLASSIIQTMDTSIDPCHNFYEYACGNWIKNTHIPEGYGKIDTMKSQKEKERDMKLVLETPARDDDPKAIKDAKSFYTSCMDTETREQNGVTVVNTKVQNTFGGWPVLEDNLGGNFNPSNFDMTTLLAGLFVEAGSTSLISASVVYDPEFKLEISAGKMTGLPSEEYLVDDKYSKERDAYVKYMTDVAILLGAHPAVATPEMLALLDLEKRLAQAKLDSKPTPEENVTVAVMQTRYPQINWMIFLKTLVPESVAQITENFVVVNTDADYLEKAIAILDDVPTRLRADWMIWIYYHNAAVYLNDAIRNAYYEFAKVAYGMPPREYFQNCVAVTTHLLHSATSRLYVVNYLPLITQLRIENIVGTLKEVQKTLVDDSGSFEAEEKEMIASKLSEAMFNIRLPEYVGDNELLDQEYENLKDFGDDVFVNYQTTKAFRIQQNIALLSEEGFENQYLHGSQPMGDKRVSGVHREDAQPPLYGHVWPWYINLGKIGMVIARDLTLNIHPVSTLKAETKECFKEQYSNFHLPENGINVPVNENEILGDNAGLQIATQAFLSGLPRKDKRTLPGLDLTSHQLFFLNSAQLWCEKYTPEYADNFEANGETSGRARVNGMMQNSVEFSEAFGCPMGQGMNPDKKCIVY